MEKGTISILLPIYNMESTVEDSIRSVLRQKNAIFELIIVDDGSNDDTPSKLTKYRGNRNIKIFRQSKKGKNAAFNKAFSESNGEYFVFFAADDLMPEDSLFLRKQLLETKKDAYAVVSGKICTFSKIKKNNNVLVPKKNIPNFSGGAIMFSRAIAEKIFPLPEDLPNEDTWARLVIKKYASEIRVLNKIVLKYRVYEGNSMQKDEKFEKFTKNLHSRAKAYEIFKERYDKDLTLEEKTVLEKKIELENLRYKGKWRKILTYKGISRKEKIRNIVYSNKFLYKIKITWYRFFTGWME